MTRTERRRLINAIVFFAEHTQRCGKIKLFKLLYLLDFAHFRETGRSVTGLDYAAWKLGPVPTDLMAEWEVDETTQFNGGTPADLVAAVHIEPEMTSRGVRQTVVRNDGYEFDDGDFTPRQLQIMQELAERYRTTMAPTMIDLTHAENGAWDQVWRAGAGKNDPIPYDLALPHDNALHEVVSEAARDMRAFRRAFATG